MLTTYEFTKKFMGRLAVFMVFLFACTLFLGRYGVSEGFMTDSDVLANEDKHIYTIVIDAGHGGEDGGAVGVNGKLEKELNFAIATRLQEILESKGYHAVLTRKDDRLLYTEEQNIYGQRKLYDLRNRLEIAAKEENPILISIHMNSFPQAKYSGLQVYYSKNHPASRALASKICTEVQQNLQPENKRQIKEAGSSIYLLNRATMPAVMVECGFLSNQGECQLLSDAAYQSKLSLVLSDAIIAQISSMTEDGGDC